VYRADVADAASAKMVAQKQIAIVTKNLILPPFKCKSTVRVRRQFQSKQSKKKNCAVPLGCRPIQEIQKSFEN
jgi:hypothetical protein